MTPSTSGIDPTEPPVHDTADSSPDSDGHPAAEEISDLIEELLPSETAEALRAHLAGCPECADTHAALREVASLLGRVEEPRMPADVARRIEAALAAEVLGASEADAADRLPHPVLAPSTSRTGRTGERARPGGAGAPTGGPGRTTRRRRLVRRVLSAATLIAVVGLGGVVVRGLPTGSGTASSSAKQADRAAGRSGAAAQAPQYFNGAKAPANTPGSAGSGTTYTEENLGPQIMQLVGDRLQPSATPAAPRTKPSQPLLDGAANGRATPTPSLPGCVLEATGRIGDEPVATDLGTFQGDPVDVVVYLDNDSDDALEVFLIDATCELSTPSGPGTVKLHRTVPKH